MMVEVKDKEQIKELLTFFSSELSSLNEGKKSIEEMAEKFAKAGCVLSIRQEEPVAFAAFYANDMEKKKAFLSMIAVNPNNKRMGYGKRMMAAVMKSANEQGMKSLRLEVRKDNKGAIAFYEREGFTFTEETEHSVFMEKKLED